jgi:hypothetical protein
MFVKNDLSLINIISTGRWRNKITASRNFHFPEENKTIEVGKNTDGKHQWQSRSRY